MSSDILGCGMIRSEPNMTSLLSRAAVHRNGLISNRADSTFTNVVEIERLTNELMILN